MSVAVKYETEQVVALYNEFNELRNQIIHGEDFEDQFADFVVDVQPFAHVSSREVGLTPDQMVGLLWGEIALNELGQRS